MVGFKQLALWATALLPATISALPKPAVRDTDIIAGKYIITLQDGLDSAAVESHMSHTAGIHARSSADGGLFSGIAKKWAFNTFNGYSASFDDATVELVKAMPDVFSVEPVRTRHLHVNQPGATWGLGSISHASPANSTVYSYDAAAGEGTFAYVIDTGLQTTHEEFQMPDGTSRAVLGYNAVDGVPFEDIDGHGTHTAGTICGKTYGVAKEATCVSVKVFNGGGASTEVILEAYNWAVNDIVSKGREAVSVISMSLGGGYSEAENRALQAAFDAGILTVVSAGNDNVDASGVSPASAPAALTVGAADKGETRAYFSNYGEVVDLFAPGVGVKSSWIGASDDETELLDGTSMACPHVSGLALYLKSVYGDEAAGPQHVTDMIKGLAVRGQIKDPQGPNLRAYNGFA